MPKKQRDWVKRQLREAWRQETEKKALAALRRLATQLEVVTYWIFVKVSKSISNLWVRRINVLITFTMLRDVAS